LFISFNRRGRADTLSTSDAADVTSRGIHAGSTRAALLRAYPGLRRSWEGYHLLNDPARAPRCREVEFLLVGNRVQLIIVNTTVDY
jgi:hypothetical protein